jgi:alpha-L-rhamnosidase
MGPLLLRMPALRTEWWMENALAGQVNFRHIFCFSMNSKLPLSRFLLRFISLVCHGLLATGFILMQGSAQTLEVAHLTTNGRVNPLGIPADNISFSWASTSQSRGAAQQSYQLRVGSAAGLADVWDSGEITSARQIDVELPSTVQLVSATRYYWQVRIRDGNGLWSGWCDPAWFETGLLSEGDWAGADWITRPVQSPSLADWTNYTATVRFTLKSQAFGVFLRSSADAQNAYMMQINVTGSSPVFKPHKRTNGSYAQLTSINLAGFGYTNASLTNSTNILEFNVSGTTIITKLNGTTIDTRTGVSFASGFVGFRTYGTEAGAVQRIKVVNNTTGGTIIDQDFSTGVNGFSNAVVSNGALQLSGNTDSVYANLPSSLPLLRGKFTAGQNITSARLYASARGLYEVSINGKKAGDQFLAPGWTDYNTRIQAQTYDITGLVQAGDNVIGAALADGWYRGSVGINWTQVYGTQLSFIAKVRITYADGSTQWFATSPTWKASDGPIVAADLQDGESYNSQLEQTGWDTTAFSDSSWLAATAVASVSSRLKPQSDEPVREITVLTAKSRTEIIPGTWVYDLGQNMVGVPRVVLSGTAGQTITLRHAEEVYRTGSMTGQIYTDNLRTAKATDTYTFGTNGSVTYQPKFTQHGFRYIEITGTTSPPAAAEVKGVVLSSDMPYTGELETSSTMLNQLVSNIRWGQRSNFLSIPTDTPARDERLGWTGDINVFAPTASRLADTRSFLSKWMGDVRDVQKSNGNIPAVVPQPQGQFDETGVGWADAFITIPYATWKAFGDERIIRENWTAMKTFYQFVYSSATSDGDLLEQGRSSWFSGDWLSLESGWNRLEEHKVIATAYFAEDTRMMAEMAAVMGETTQASQWSALVPQIRAAFVNAYRNADGSIYQGTQAVYALALGMDMISDPAQREQTGQKFIAKLAADDNHLRTGFLGTPWLLPALSKIGRDDLAIQILGKQDYPSWGFPISMGATTMWERWNSIQPDGTFGPVDMNSFNHYAYGAVGDWMFGKLGGIAMVEPGYKTSRIKPLIGFGGLSSARCKQETAYGTLISQWQVSATGYALHVEVPANTTSIVHVPHGVGTTVYEGAVPAETAPGVQFLSIDGDARIYSIGSGSYDFSWAPPLSAPSGLLAAAEVGQVSLTWNPVAGASGYDLKRSTTAGGPYVTVGNNLTSTAFTDTNVFRGKTYFYVVCAKSGASVSADSAEASASPLVAINSGFESPVTATYSYNPTGGTWQFDSDSGVAANGSIFTTTQAAPAGSQTAFLQRLGSFSQRVTGLVPGLSYDIVYQAAQRISGASWNLVGQTWDVRIDGSTIGSFAPPQSATSYTEYRARFTATATSHLLTFVGTNLKGGDNTVFIDGVKLLPVAVPIAADEMRAPSIQCLPDGSGSSTVRITALNSVPGHEYILQSSFDLNPSTWQMASLPLLGNGGDLVFLTSFLSNSSREFFRIMISE